MRIKNATEFYTFVNSVNSRSRYSGFTVFLDSDLSFAEKTFEPIGKDDTKCFLGTFDGQGHVISDLKINSTSQYAGLFGYSEGLAIRDVVLDSSCSIISSYSGSDDVYVGGIIGYCQSEKNSYIENSVNMAGVAFNEKTWGSALYLGGIAGQLYPYYRSYDYYPIYVKNCANYGPLAHSGSASESYMGGIAGYTYVWGSSEYTYIYNCINYGTITYSSSGSGLLYLGGIVGYNSNTYIENCVSAGKIESTRSSYTGSIVGYAYEYSYINYSYYANELREYDICGRDFYGISVSNTLSYDNSSFELSEPVSIGNYAGVSLIDALNTAAGYYVLRDYSKWLLNKNGNVVTFKINNNRSISLDYEVILLPSLASCGNLVFSGWYSDNKYINSLESFEIIEDKELYGKFEESNNNFTITLDARKDGVFVEPITARYLSRVSLPYHLNGDYCSIAFWENEYGYNFGMSISMPAHNFTLYAVWKCTHVATPDDFIDFSKITNSGKDYYSGTTVYLDSDLSLAGKTLEPIGKDASKYFKGVFDGQGYIISDLKMNSSSQYAGLFGYSEGLTIRNVVLDSSCSIMSTHSKSYWVYVGGIIGSCHTNNGPCNIENVINIANVTFSGNISGYILYLGGIAGELYTYYSSFDSYPIYVKNCANYGSVTYSGTSGYSYIGGVIGYLEGSAFYYVHLSNSLNYGTITYNGTTSSSLDIGGIVGYSYYTYVENCVSEGKITTPSTSSSNTKIGSVVGCTRDYVYINYCYYMNDLSGYDFYGGGTPINTSYSLSYDSTTFKLSKSVSIGGNIKSYLVDALNAYSDFYSLRDYSKWLNNKDGKNVKFTINGRKNPTVLKYKIILLPGLASEGSLMFYGWYTDNNCGNLLESFEITEDKNLYGKFGVNTNNYTIAFDTRRDGLFIPQQPAQFGTVVSLRKDSVRSYCSVAFWENEYGDDVGLSITMPAHDLTLYAVWECTRIASPDDFIDFSRVKNSKVTYLRTTVYLDSDLSFSGKSTEPIGKDYPNYFRGVFDGQGHVISDLKMNISSSGYAGLIGYSDGLAIKNVVLGSSCSITNSYEPDRVYMGGIIGYCRSDYENCSVENSINMADVTFNGNNEHYYLYLGGIAGELISKNYIKNCANYGSITHSGTRYYSYIGGIIGEIYGYNSYDYIQNSLNYGTITHTGTTKEYLCIGGIVGKGQYTYIENCVSAGEISTSATASYGNHIGTIVGNAYSYIYINYCYYASGVGGYQINGTGMPESTEGTSNSPTSVDSSLVSSLNGYATNNGWNKWLLNENNKAVTFKINGDKGFTLSPTLIILPDIFSEWRSFVAWFTDSAFTTSFSGSSVSTDMTLYGRWDIFILTFDPNGGSVSVRSRNIVHNSAYGELPEASRSEYAFKGWFTERTGGAKVTSSTTLTTPSDVTIYAQWITDESSQVEPSSEEINYAWTPYPLMQLIYFLM